MSDNVSVPFTPFFLLSPDGFTLSVDAKPYSSLEKAIQDFEEWKKGYQPQGYYSSTKYGRINLEDLKHYMIISKTPF